MDNDAAERWIRKTVYKATLWLVLLLPLLVALLLLALPGMSSAQPAPPSQVNPTTIDDGISRAGSWQKATPSATCSALYDVHGAGAQRSDPKTSSGLVPMGVACNGSTASIAMPEIPNTDFLFTTD